MLLYVYCFFKNFLGESKDGVSNNFEKYRYMYRLTSSLMYKKTIDFSFLKVKSNYVEVFARMLKPPSVYRVAIVLIISK